jgi:hypothetical protein
MNVVSEDIIDKTGATNAPASHFLMSYNNFVERMLIGSQQG